MVTVEVRSPRIRLRDREVVRFVVRRLVMLVVALVVASFVTYAALYLSPGSPISVLAGGRSIPPEAVARLTELYHLNDPFLLRYGLWVLDVLQGRLGESIIFHIPVAELIAQRAGTTVWLVIYASVIVVVVGVGAGIASGLRRGVLDGVVVTVSAVLAGTPAFVAALILLSVFAVSLQWFPAIGAGTGFVDQLWHLTLPAVALALGTMASVLRVTRASVRAVFARDHVRTALSRGLPGSVQVRRHVLRNASIPIATVVGVTLTSLIAMSAVVDVAFTLNGLGSTLVQAALAHDFAVVQAITLLIVAAFAIANSLVDFSYVLLDPRATLRSD